jgi:hypothetical protein
MEAGSAFDGVAFVGESGASFSDDVVEFVDRRDVFVGLDPTVILVANSGAGASHAGCVTLTHG